MTTIIGTKELAEINQKVVQNGEVLPQVKLKMVVECKQEQLPPCCIILISIMQAFEVR